MRTILHHIGRVAVIFFALAITAVPVFASARKSIEVSNYHTPKQQSDVLQWLAPKEGQKVITNSRATLQTVNYSKQSERNFAPTIKVSNAILDRQVSPTAPMGDISAPTAQMQSMAVRLYETHEMKGTYHSTITAVGAGFEEVAMYSTTFSPPTARYAPPGTGGGNPENPDIPVPLGDGIGILFMIAIVYGLIKKNRHAFAHVDFLLYLCGDFEK